MPVRSLIWTFGIMGTATLLLAISLEGFALIRPSKDGSTAAIGAFCAMLGSACLLKIFAFSRERVRIEDSKIVHEKWGASIEIDPRDIESLKFQKDFLWVKTISRPKALLIPLCFERIHLLFTALRAWRPELFPQRDQPR
jgi:hypothetical protein